MEPAERQITQRYLLHCATGDQLVALASLCCCENMQIEGLQSENVPSRPIVAARLPEPYGATMSSQYRLLQCLICLIQTTHR